MSASTVGREIVLGRNSRVWKTLVTNPKIASRFPTAITHNELEEFRFAPSDRVWVFSYSSELDENIRMLERLQAVVRGEVIYISSSSTIVTRVTQCYRYPRVKQRAALAAGRLNGARILCLGLVYERQSDLPSGVNAATSYAELIDFMLCPRWSDEMRGEILLFKLVDVPDRSAIEAKLRQLYSAAQWRLRGWPCLLRPIDLLLRILGFRWYGYTNLSNRLWSTTI